MCCSPRPGTFSPEEVQERVFAINKARAAAGESQRLTLKSHPLFAAACAPGDTLCQNLADKDRCLPNAHLMDRHVLHKKHPLCGAQRTVQRWYADPLLNGKKDHTLRTVFTHDHFGPSSHQQHGLYAALVVEPANSVWLPIDKANVDWDALCAAPPAQRRSMLIGGANLSDQYDAECQRRSALTPVAAETLMHESVGSKQEQKVSPNPTPTSQIGYCSKHGMLLIRAS